MAASTKGGLSTAADSPPPVQTCALMLLSTLCDPALSSPEEGRLLPENLRRLRKAEGIPVLLNRLELIQSLDPTLPSAFALACFGAIWSCVVPDRKNAARFLVAEGMDLLLDALERGHPSHRPLALSLLSDLLENPRSLPFFHEWRSGLDQQPAAHLLIRFWREEDSLRGLTVHGILANTTHPLVGLDKRTRWVPPEAVAYGNTLPQRRAQLQAVSEACSSDQILSKIYSVLKLCGMAKASSSLPLEDQATLCLIEKFVKFKQGEVWRQIRDELEQEGIRPTAPDRERLASGVELAETLAVAVRDAQKKILEKHVGIIREKESKFFADALGQKKYEQDMKFFGLAKDKSLLTLAEIKEAKEKRAQMLAHSIRDATLLQTHIVVDHQEEEPRP